MIITGAPGNRSGGASCATWLHPGIPISSQLAGCNRSSCLHGGRLFASTISDSALYLYVASLFVFQVPVLNGMNVAVPTVAGIFFLAVEGLRRFGDRNGTASRSRIPLLVLVVSLIYLGVALANSEWTFGHPRVAITYFALLAATLATGYALRDPVRAWRVTWIFTVGSGVVSLETIYEAVTGHFNVFSIFPSYADRAYGFADPNFTAAFLVTMLPFMVAHLGIGRRVRGRIVPACLLLLSLAGICMTGSRGGIVGCIVTFVAISIFGPFAPGRRSLGKGFKPRSVRSAMSRPGLLAVLVASTVIAAYMAPSMLWERLSTYQEWSDPTNESRLQYWGDYIEKWQTSPWVGKGPGYIIAEGEEPHNTVIQVLIEVGVFGFAGFVLLNAFAFWESVSARRRLALMGQSRMSVISGAVASAFVGFHATGFFLHCATHKELWFLIGFASALTHMSRSNPTPSLDNA